VAVQQTEQLNQLSNDDTADQKVGEQQQFVAHADVQQAQEEGEEQQLVQLNQLANDGTAGQKAGEQWESFDPQDYASHTYYAQADMQHVGCVEGMVEENLTSQPKRGRKGGEEEGRVGKSRAKLRSKAKRAVSQRCETDAQLASKRGRTKSTVA
jgi:hypothetical protein